MTNLTKPKLAPHKLLIADSSHFLYFQARKMSAENTMASSIKNARVRMDAKTKAVVTELIGEDGMDAFLKSEKDDGHHNPEDYDYEKSEDQLETRFAHILADMLIAAAPEAAQRTASIDSPTPVKDSSRAAAEAAAIIDKMCPFEIHSKKIADGGVGKNDGGMEYFLWKLWCVFEAAIKAVPYDNALQYELWGFLRTLKSKSRGVVKVWGVSICPVLDETAYTADKKKTELTQLL